MQQDQFKIMDSHHIKFELYLQNSLSNQPLQFEIQRIFNTNWDSFSETYIVYVRLQDPQTVHMIVIVSVKPPCCKPMSC